ncbi:hypothetical protein [Nonomuraea jiangxiensis]|uniref:Uncharacterized protein n=1 Tax=Nonomuraea jiangxiensis TaxID=633440 RepID=A0A1G9WCP7_9ACTN|nr:hypothetical protein [Nonomuraea jiangxiensis]SDM81966.1 hypothetical protein SAMN05421869_1583 [Nonomuraea jiangxiensis]
MADGPVAHLTLIAHGPDLQAFELTEVPVDTLVRDVAQAVMEQYPGVAPRPCVTDFQEADGTRRRLDPEATLEESGVTSAGTIMVSAEATAGGLDVSMMVDLATFLGTAVASGVAGNAAYDFLKAQISRMRAKRVRRLTKREAIQVAHACVCIQRGLPRDQVRLTGARRGALHKREGDRRPPRTWALDFEFGGRTDTVHVFLDRSEPGAEAIKIWNLEAELSALRRPADPPAT